MTNPDKRLRFEGTKITRERALEGLGDPTVWEREEQEFEAAFRKEYEDAPPPAEKQPARPSPRKSPSRRESPASARLLSSERTPGGGKPRARATHGGGKADASAPPAPPRLDKARRKPR